MSFDPQIAAETLAAVDSEITFTSTEKYSMFQIDEHRLTFYPDLQALSLSKSGVTQGQERFAEAADFLAAAERLFEWYQKHGTDFIADQGFVDYVLRGDR